MSGPTPIPSRPKWFAQAQLTDTTPGLPGDGARRPGATVTAGVYVGSHLSAIFSPGTRLQAFAFLDVLVFLLNGVLFTLVGMELVRSVHWVPGMPAARGV